MDRLTVKFYDNSQIVIKTKRNTAMNYWEVDYAHKVHHIQEAYIDTYPLKNHSRKWLVGGPGGRRRKNALGQKEIEDPINPKELKVKVPYVCVSDDGAEIVTSAILNIRTCVVTDIETADPQDTVQEYEREYIVINGDQVEVHSGDGDGYWIGLHHGHAGPCTEDYVAHMEAMSDLSVTYLIKVVDYIVALSQYLNEDNEILGDMGSVLEPLNKVISELKTEEICSCGNYLYKSDLAQYNSVCPECDENF